MIGWREAVAAGVFDEVAKRPDRDELVHDTRYGWAPGPWLDEPDKLVWIDPATGLDCMAKRGPMGVWCGYVGVAEDHPAFGRDKDEVQGILTEGVHGGLTFGDFCDDREDVPSAERICHTPRPGRPDRVYWLGFDCGHYMDVSPHMVAVERSLGWEPIRGAPVMTYRDADFVIAEVESLACQLAGARSD